MNAHRPRRLNRGAAERLLSGVATDAWDGPDALARLIAASRATPHPDEFVGEEVAMAAFQAAQLGLPIQSWRRSMIETAIAKLLTLKVAAAAVVTVAATGGVALAAANGALPNPLGGNHPTAKPSATAGDHGKNDPSAKGTKGTPSPSLVGLCRAFKAGAGDNPGKALENPAFTVLITTAGDKEKVAAYCDELLAAEKAGHVTKAPADRPSGAPETHPTGKADSRPTSEPAPKPTDHPTVPATPGANG
jgi:hypothetical protein